MAFGTMSQRRPRFGAVNPLDPETSRSVQSLATAMRGSRPGLPSVRPNMDPGYAPSFTPTQGGGFTRIGIPQSGPVMTLFAGGYGGMPMQSEFGGGTAPPAPQRPPMRGMGLGIGVRPAIGASGAVGQNIRQPFGVQSGAVQPQPAPYIAPNGMRGVNPQQFPTPPAAQQQQDLLNLNRGYEQQSQQLGTYGFRYGQDGRPQMPALTAGEQAMIDRQRSYDASSDPMGAASSYDRFRPGGAFGSPAPAAQYQPTLLPNNTPVGTQTTILNRDDGRQVGLTGNFRGDANSYQPITSGDAAVDARRANATRAAQQGTAYFGTRVVPREQNQGRATGLPGVPRAVARGMSPEQVQGIQQAGVNTRRQAFGLPSVSMGQSGTTPSSTSPGYTPGQAPTGSVTARQNDFSQHVATNAGLYESMQVDPSTAGLYDMADGFSKLDNPSQQDEQAFKAGLDKRAANDAEFRKHLDALLTDGEQITNKAGLREPIYANTPQGEHANRIRAMYGLPPIERQFEYGSGGYPTGAF